MSKNQTIPPLKQRLIFFLRFRTQKWAQTLLLTLFMIAFSACLPLTPALLEELEVGSPVVIDPNSISPQTSFAPVLVRYGSGCASTEFRLDDIIDQDAPTSLEWRVDFYAQDRSPEQVGSGSLFAVSEKNPSAFKGPCLSLGNLENRPATCEDANPVRIENLNDDVYLLRFSVTDGSFTSRRDPDALSPDEAHLDQFIWPFSIDKEGPCDAQ